MGNVSRHDWDIDRVYEMVRAIAETIPDRLPGTEAARQMAEYSRERLEEAGATATIIPVHALTSIPKPANLTLIAPFEKTIPSLTMAHSPSTETPIEGELIDVGLGGWDDYEGVDAVGKVTLSALSYSPPRQEKQRIAGAKGTSAQIMMNWGHAESDELPMGSVKSGWGNPTQQDLLLSEASVPCLGISRRDGLMLKQLCAETRPRVRLETSAENAWRDIHLTVGEVPARYSEDFVLVGGHQDGWFGAAATDNAAGTAIMIELARHFSEREADLKRGLVFGFWAGHETGTMAGSTWWADRHWDRLRDHCIGYLQIDQPACIGTSGWSVTSNLELRAMAERIHEVSGDRSELHWAPQIKNGDSSFFGIGIPMIVAHARFPDRELQMTANAAYGWWHHTLKNSIDKVDKAAIAKHLDMYAAYVERLATSHVLPTRFSVLGQSLEFRIRELCKDSADGTLGLEYLHRQAMALRGRLMALDRVADELAYSGTSDADVRGINDILKRLSRVLIPVASTVAGKYGHDPYGMTEQTTVLPGLYHLKAIDRINDRADREMVWGELIRARNRVSDALREAIHLVASVNELRTT